MNEISTFHFDTSAVRTLTLANEPWFVARDVCDVLGIANVSQALDRLDDDERSMLNIGRQGDTNIISESGLYALVLRSKKPEAKPFRKWVTATILPTIRKSGSYVAGEEAFDVTTEAGLASATLHVMAALQAKADSFKAMYEAAKPKADAFAIIEEASGSLTVTDAAKALKAKRTALYGYLEGKGWVTKGKQRQPTARAVKHGYMDARTHTDSFGTIRTTPVITPKGFAYLANVKAQNASRS